eukprot:3357994-Ditylum_brightwellii.AAC.1
MTKKRSPVDKLGGNPPPYMRRGNGGSTDFNKREAGRDGSITSLDASADNDGGTATNAIEATSVAGKPSPNTSANNDCCTASDPSDGRSNA